MARPRTPHSDTRHRILAAAADEFGAHGFAATTIDRIARRARVNKAMIYYHFPEQARPLHLHHPATSSPPSPSAFARRWPRMPRPTASSTA